jgi:CRP-like cAMP-binding protein
MDKPITEKNYPAKTTLLNEGEVAKNIYIVKKGCLRLFFLHDGKEITFQFFFEGDTVASFESIYNDQPSMFTLQTIEPATLRIIGREEFRKALDNPDIRTGFEQRLAQRFITYQKLFLSRIKNSPQERYEELLRERPDIIKRVPQHYIASYLGITPVSLSRIRNRR